MTEFLNWLNLNQGLIGFLSLLVTLVGFFVVNSNIKVIYRQSQKSGDKGVNQQAQKGGVNQNAGRNAISNKK